jgi:hypothetical protein
MVCRRGLCRRCEQLNLARLLLLVDIVLRKQGCYCLAQVAVVLRTNQKNLILQERQNTFC